MNKTKLTCLISGCVAAAAFMAALTQIFIFIAGIIFNNSAASQIGIIGGADTELSMFFVRMYISDNIPFLLISLFFIVSLIIFIVNLIKMLSAKKAN